jgi:hypothetical protein
MRIGSLAGLGTGWPELPRWCGNVPSLRSVSGSVTPREQIGPCVSFHAAESRTDCMPMTFEQRGRS